MKTRSLILTAVVCTTITLITGCDDSSQKGGVESNTASSGDSNMQIGRYQVLPAGESKNAFFVDTVTGDTWFYNEGSDRWWDRGNPATGRKPGQQIPR